MSLSPAPFSRPLSWRRRCGARCRQGPAQSPRIGSSGTVDSKIRTLCPRWARPRDLPAVKAHRAGSRRPRGGANGKRSAGSRQTILALCRTLAWSVDLFVLRSVTRSASAVQPLAAGSTGPRRPRRTVSRPLRTDTESASATLLTIRPPKCVPVKSYRHLKVTNVLRSGLVRGRSCPTGLIGPR
jgi:hypothetical protein